MIYTFTQLPPRELSTDELPQKTIALNITRSVDALSSDFVLTPAHIMAFAQRAWRLSPENANDAKLILATYSVQGKGRLILGAFQFGRANEKPEPDHFIQSPFGDEERRCIFLAEPADSCYWKKYVGHYLPKPRKGEANPVRYYDFD